MSKTPAVFVWHPGRQLGFHELLCPSSLEVSHVGKPLESSADAGLRGRSASDLLLYEEDGRLLRAPRGFWHEHTLRTP